MRSAAAGGSSVTSSVCLGPAVVAVSARTRSTGHPAATGVRGGGAGTGAPRRRFERSGRARLHVDRARRAASSAASDARRSRPRRPRPRAPPAAPPRAPPAGRRRAGAPHWPPPSASRRRPARAPGRRRARRRGTPAPSRCPGRRDVAAQHPAGAGGDAGDRRGHRRAGRARSGASTRTARSRRRRAPRAGRVRPPPARPTTTVTSSPWPRRGAGPSRARPRSAAEIPALPVVATGRRPTSSRRRSRAPEDDAVARPRGTTTRSRPPGCRPGSRCRTRSTARS